VSSTGGREHLLLVASPQPLPELEKDLAALPTPRAEGPAALPLPSGTRNKLRGIGHLFAGGTTSPHLTPGRLSELASRLGVDRETAKRIWVRQIDLENPGP
jgi:hypothetical protein